ncbi:MAG: hypothetical protein HKN23_10920 [Verrucomicrobiales bacterium]|nr:hypothetical protein [Verrucomicrobiales bacterium]
MKPPLFLFVATCFASAIFATEHTHNGWEICAKKHHAYSLRAQWEASVRPDDPSAGNGRKYARDREIDVLHQKIEFTPNFGMRTLEGISTTTFKPIAKPLRTLKLDAVGLRVEQIESTAEIEDWHVGESAIAITFKSEIEPDAETSVTVNYSAQPPENGLYFRTEAMGYPKGDDHLWTQGEPEKHRYWFPGYDYPNERFTTEVICHVPEGMTVLSNGELVGQKTENGVSTFHWHQKKEHVNYLISVVAGYLKKLDDKYGDLELAFYTPPSEFAVAENSFRDTAKILEFFEQELGVKYPWAKYYNICVSDFVAGGMENTSVTTLTTGTLFSADSENLRTSHRLDAHEVAHQWFGDLLTCRDWTQLWLNEGFATYYTHLYELHKSGEDDFLYGLHRDANRVTGANDEKPITWRGYKDPMEQFDERAYPKGSWVLHMLRSQLGPELYRKCITEYLNRHRNQTVETSDLKAVFEELSGRNLDEFFDQWVHHGGSPKLKIAFSWDQTKKQAKLKIEQTQKVSEKVMLFDFPLPVRFIDKDGNATDETVRVHLESEDFTFDLDQKPEIARIDPDLTVLKTVDFKLPNPMLFAQLANGDDMLGRLIAVKQLSGRKDHQSIEKLKATLNGDEFYGARMVAADSLAAAKSPEALAALIDSMEQDDARARQKVVQSIGKFYDDAAFDALVGVVESEKNPEIVADAVAAIGKFPEDKNVQEILTKALARESYRNRIANAAIRAMASHGDPEFVPVLREYLGENEAKFVSRDYGNALVTLARLSRDEDPDSIRDGIRYFLSSKLNHPKARIRPTVIRALGELSDPRAVPVLQTFTDAGDTNLAKAATDAIAKLNGGKKQADEVRDLRNQVNELQKQLRELSGKVEKIGKN